MSIIDKIRQRIEKKRLQDKVWDFLIMEEILSGNFLTDRASPSRLKFHVGDNHVEIIIGKPVCYCKVYDFHRGLGFEAVSVCNPKDTYNWKTGAVQSLTNLLDFMVVSREERGKYFDAMFKKYPELKK